jgi:hypothetical protein
VLGDDIHHRVVGVADATAQHYRSASHGTCAG